MLSFFERLDKYMDYKGLNDNKITVQAGLANGIIGKARKRGALSQDNISKILYFYPELNANWLLTGEGEMLKDQTSASSSTAVDCDITYFGELVKSQQRTIENLSQTIENLSRTIENLTKK